MARAIMNGVVIAESPSFEVVEGNVYFPPDALKQQYFEPSDRHTVCSWKGTASYYNVRVGDVLDENVAWYYPDPRPAASNIKDHVAFYGRVTIEQ